MATLYEGLLAFKDLYDNSISNESSRDIKKYDRDWQTISNEQVCYYNALATGDSTAADYHLGNIVAILNGYNLSVDLPIPLPISLSVNGSPSTILVPSDNDGSNPVYTNAFSAIIILQGTSDETTNWTFVVGTETDVTAVIQNDNEVKIDAMTGNEGSVIVTASREGYSDLSILIPVQKQLKGDVGSIENIDETTIVENVSGDIEANKVQVDDTRDLYAVNCTGDIEDITGSTSSGNTYINSPLESSGDTNSSFQDNVYILAPTYHGGVSFDKDIRDNYFIGSPSGTNGMYPSSEPSIVGARSFMADNGAPSGRGVASYSSVLGSAASNFSVGSTTIGLYGYQWYSVDGSYTEQFSPRKIIGNIETFTDGTAKEFAGVDVVFGNTEEFRIFNREDVTSETYFRFEYDTSYSAFQVGHITAYVTGRDITTGDLFFKEYTMQIIENTIVNVTETVAKTVEQGTMSGTTISFPATSGTFNPSVTSGSTNPCYWSMMIEAFVVPYRL